LIAFEHLNLLARPVCFWSVSLACGQRLQPV
jgi:hypothetical protein